MAPSSEATPRTLANERRGEGRRVVLVHGFTQSKGSWRAIAERLAGDYEVVTVDLPNHGGSSSTNAASLDEAAELLGATGGPASYVGYSLGGRVCLTLALSHPELVEALVLIGATAGIKTEADRAARRAADEALADRIDPTRGGLALEAFLDEWLAGPLFAHLDATTADRDSRRANTTAGLAASLRTTGTGTQVPSYDRLHELTMPVLLLAGGSDARFAKIAAEMAGLIGDNAATALVEGAGHAAPYESPARFVELLGAFLSTT